MTRFLLLLSVLPALACTEAASDVYWLELTPDERPCPDAAVEENYTTAAAADDAGQPGRPKQSGAAGYVLVTRAVDGSVLVNFDEHVLTGTEGADGAIDVAWTGFDEFGEEESTSDYVFSFREAANVEESLTLRPMADETQPWSGTYALSSVYSWDYTETDEWSDGLTFSLMPTFQILEATNPDVPLGSSNLPDRDDCEGDECRIAVSGDCTEVYEVRAVRLDDVAPAEFDVLAGFGRDFGSGQPPGPLTPL